MSWLVNVCKWHRFGGSFKFHQSVIKFTRCSLYSGYVSMIEHHNGKIRSQDCQPYMSDSTSSLLSYTLPSFFGTKVIIGCQDTSFMKNKKSFFKSIHRHNDQFLTVKHCRHLNTGNQSSDINQSWIERFPKSVQPYMVLSRIDRPIGYWLLFFPGAWSISLAADAGEIPNTQLLILFLVGSVLMRSAGCVINDMWDSDLDKKVARTLTRPIASGDITHFQGLLFLAGQLSISLGILLSLNQYSMILGASSLVLVASYPLMKRITYWPQLALGLTINWGCLLGWSAVTGSLDLSVCLPLYIAAISWTIFYDTIYAFQDVEDDRWIGVKSTALLFGDSAKPCLTGFAAVTVANLIAVGINTAQTWPYYLGLMAVTSHLIWQVATVDLSKPNDCLSKFKSNKWLGVLLWMSIVMGTLWKSEQKNTENYKDNEPTASRITNTWSGF